MSLERVITIGYEGADQGDFLATLGALKVDVLLDIRELAISRRKGFAKNAMRAGLNSVGIQYRHEPSLGSPKALRNKLRDDGDYKSFFKGFAGYLTTQQPLLEVLAKELSGTVALLCFERDPDTCHRKVVAQALAEITGIKPAHMGVHTHAQRQAFAHSRASTGQGLPAT